MRRRNAILSGAYVTRARVGPCAIPDSAGECNKPAAARLMSGCGAVAQEKRGCLPENTEYIRYIPNTITEDRVTVAENGFI